MVVGKAPRKQLREVDRSSKPLAAVGPLPPGSAADATAWAESELAQRLAEEADAFLGSGPEKLQSKTGGKLSLQACEDAVQRAVYNTMVRVRDGSLSGDVNLAGYLRKAAWNLALNQLDADARVELAGEVVEPAVAVAVAVAPLPEQVAVGDVDPMADLVIPAIDALPPSKRRQVVRLQSQGLDDIHIAAALGIRTDRLHKERHIAVKELKGALQEFIRDRHGKSSEPGNKDR